MCASELAIRWLPELQKSFPTGGFCHHHANTRPWTSVPVATALTMTAQELRLCRVSIQCALRRADSREETGPSSSSSEPQHSTNRPAASLASW